MRILFTVGLLWSGVCLILLWLNHRFPRNRIAKPNAGEMMRDRTGAEALYISSGIGKLAEKIA
ncbi:MAG TPA: hypothetical protein VHO84_06440 [Syntrophorhabdaceae bacterium]|nr:hypothetical protein [Syntrophorhabdaceae bacterium]